MSANQRKFDASRLTPNQLYRVIAPFTDYDGKVHPVGEEWRFLEKNFAPHDDGLSLFVEQNGQRVQIRMQWLDDAQGHTIDNFSDYVEEI
jgi:hypothetical protein